MINQLRILFLLSCIICFNLKLFAQIGGTDCASAVNININACSTSASFLATQGVNGNANMNASCGGLAVKVGAWFKFTTAVSPPATISTTITVNSNSQALAGRNLAIELYQDAGCPTAPTYMSCAESGVTNPEVIVATLNASTTYYIRLVNVGTGTAFNVANTFVCVKQTPANDVVGGAIPLAVGNGTCSNTVYGVSSHSVATNSSGSGADCWPSPPCGTYAAGSNDVWFSAEVPPSGNFFIQTTGTILQNYGMAVYSSSNCAAAATSILGCSTHNPEGLTGSVNWTMMPTLNIIGAVANSTVYVRVWKEAAAIGTFSICVNDMGPCGNLPNNDFCSNPTFISTSGGPSDIAYNQTGITYTTDKPGNLQTTTQHGVAPCVAPVNNAWYTFIATTANASGLTIPFAVGASCTNVSATIFSVTTNSLGCCKEFTAVACAPATAANGTFNLTVPSGSLIPGNTYYLMVNQAGTPNSACQYSVTGWSIAGVLPVEFISFIGDNEGRHNLLEWITASEKNMLSYTLQHSADATNFTDVTTLSAKNDQGKVKYSVYDEKPFEDVTYYRVKQLDLNGVEKYTNTISVSLKNMYDNIYNIHPNPTTNNLNFEYYSKSNNSISMELINYAGASVIKIDQFLEEGKNNVTLPMSEFDKGVYILKVVSEASGKTTHHKIIKN